MDYHAEKTAAPAVQSSGPHAEWTSSAAVHNSGPHAVASPGLFSELLNTQYEAEAGQ